MKTEIGNIKTKSGNIKTEIANIKTKSGNKKTKSENIKAEIYLGEKFSINDDLHRSLHLNEITQREFVPSISFGNRIGILSEELGNKHSNRAPVVDRLVENSLHS